MLGKPNVHGSIFRFEGQVTVFDPSARTRAPCYRCLYPEPPPPELVPSCAEGGRARRAARRDRHCSRPSRRSSCSSASATRSSGRLLLYDALAMKFRELKLRRNPECPSAASTPASPS
jgi:molybdopterin/thiamine biosynthesis adenylyltransferase